VISEVPVGQKVLKSALILKRSETLHVVLSAGETIMFREKLTYLRFQPA
jgi:hypothetical protein